MDGKDAGTMNETNPKLQNTIPKIFPFSAVAYLVNLDWLQESQMKLVLDLKLPFLGHREPYENAGPAHCRVADSHCLVRTRFANGGATWCSIGGDEMFAGQDDWS